MPAKQVSFRNKSQNESSLTKKYNMIENHKFLFDNKDWICSILDFFDLSFFKQKNFGQYFNDELI